MSRQRDNGIHQFINSSTSLLGRCYQWKSRLVITTVVVLKIIQDSLALGFRHIFEVILVSLWQPFDNRFAFAPQFNAKEIKVQITRITTVSPGDQEGHTFQMAFQPERQYVPRPSSSTISHEPKGGLTKAHEATITIIFQPIKSTRVNGRIVR